MESNDLPIPRTAAELRSRAAHAQKLALTAMDDLTISRLEQLARDYETEAALVERSESD